MWATPRGGTQLPEGIRLGGMGDAVCWLMLIYRVPSEPPRPGRRYGGDRKRWARCTR
jgi:hypothetical protein